MSHINRQRITLVVFLAIIIGFIFFLETRKVNRGGIGAESDIPVLTDVEKAKKYEPAKEISTPDGFINTPRISIGEFVGEKVVLVDFWTYSCINCQRTLPYLNSWYEKYADQGLIIIGLHTPEFEFEKDYDNVLRAVEKFNIKYPVVLDNDFSTWRAYKNQYWPRKYLIDIDGYVVYDHIGEGAYEETEEKIVELLNERSQKIGKGQSVEINSLAPHNVDRVDFSKIGSPEMYFGSLRVRNIVNLPEIGCLEGTCLYEKFSPIPLNSYALEGEWTIDPERAILSSASGAIELTFLASKVNIVAGASQNVGARIYLDGELVSNEERGAHVSNGSIQFNAEDLYNLIDLGGVYEEHTLRIEILNPGLEAFAFTFG